MILVEKPSDLVGTDVPVPLKETKRGNKYFIMAICYNSKFLIARAIKDYKSDTTTCFLKEDLVAKHGAPKAITSDQGKNFESKVTDEFCKE